MRWRWQTLKLIWLAYRANRRIRQAARRRRHDARAAREALRAVQQTRVTRDYLAYVRRMENGK